MSKLDLGDFKKLSAEEWAAIAGNDLRGNDPFSKLQWKYDPHIIVYPYYDSVPPAMETTFNPNLDELALSGMQGRHWHYLEAVELTDSGTANKTAVAALNGAEGILWKIPAGRPLPDASEVFAGIQPEHCQNAFAFREWNAEVRGFFHQLLNTGAQLSGFLWFDTCNTKENCELLELFNGTEHFKSLCFDAISQHEKGLPPVSELSWLLSGLIEKMDSLSEAGHSVEEIVTNAIFCTGLGRDYFHEIAKLRALKLIVCKAAHGFGATGIRPSDITIFARPSIRSYGVTDPYVNIIRATTETMAGIIGGAGFVTAPPFDYLFPISPETFSRRIGRNISNLLREESYLDKNNDPSAGSFYIETLTEQLAGAAWKKMQKAEEMGGFTSAVRDGFWMKDELEFTAGEARQVATRKLNVVGINNYNDLDLLKKFPSVEEYGNIINREAVTPIGGTFELLRLKTEDFLKATPGANRPEITPVLFGDKAKALARNNFIQGVFPAAGFGVSSPLWWNGSLQAFAGISAVVLCSSDEEYLDTGIEIISKIRQTYPQMEFGVAGRPEGKDVLLKIGVSNFLHQHSDLVAILTAYQKIFGIL